MLSPIATELLTDERLARLQSFGRQGYGGWPCPRKDRPGIYQTPWPLEREHQEGAAMAMTWEEVIQTGLDSASPAVLATRKGKRATTVKEDDAGTIPKKKGNVAAKKTLQLPTKGNRLPKKK